MNTILHHDYTESKTFTYGNRTLAARIRNVTLAFVVGLALFATPVVMSTMTGDAAAGVNVALAGDCNDGTCG